ncbi:MULTISPECIES: AzlD domain-containing protein [unclassified Gordonia (in: high G+C Gram-positive bacteria)]|mgnify:CR=1 FL=1|uniref:AzlD domain-containing protein n=1 Tax=unclassified Gordonia (in: high G+C Gram-positive bacteria) TaxID=2657482 RepID=UPI001F0DDBF7|nr:AzlD domain-containing protein [Gordonia sp. ABSL49_1]MCH5641922.1 AzlD domain-containing protein [Gordonia sp. ABSL49_1]
MSGWALGIAVGVLAVGTYLIRLAGPTLRNRITISSATEALLDRAAIVLLVAVAVTGTMFVDHDFAGWARPAGVGVGVVAALCKAPIAVVVILAAATAAGLRLLGLP